MHETSDTSHEADTGCNTHAGLEAGTGCRTATDHKAGTALPLPAKLMALGGCGLMTLAADQWTKGFALTLPQEGITILPVLKFILALNRGVSFSLFPASSQEGVWLLLAMHFALCGLVLWYWLKSRSRLESLAYGLVLGGALGNILDRIRYHAVIDFILVHIDRYCWPVFNIADMAIVAGIGLLLLMHLRQSRHPGR